MKFERKNKLFDLTLLNTKIREKYLYLIDLPDYLFEEVKNLKIPVKFQLFGYNRIFEVDDAELVNLSLKWLKLIVKEVKNRYPNENFTFKVMLQTKTYTLDGDYENSSKTKTLSNFTIVNQDKALNEMVGDMYKLIQNYHMKDCNIFELLLVGTELPPSPESHKFN